MKCTQCVNNFNSLIKTPCYQIVIMELIFRNLTATDLISNQIKLDYVTLYFHKEQPTNKTV